MEFAVLGPVLVDGRPPRGAIERALLARLLVAPGAAVPAEERLRPARTATARSATPAQRSSTAAAVGRLPASPPPAPRFAGSRVRRR